MFLRHIFILGSFHLFKNPYTPSVFLSQPILFGYMDKQTHPLFVVFYVRSHSESVSGFTLREELWMILFFDAA